MKQAVLSGAMMQKCALPTNYMFQRITLSIIKNLIFENHSVKNVCRILLVLQKSLNYLRK